DGCLAVTGRVPKDEPLRDRGARPFAHPQLPEVAYAIALTRAKSGFMDVWPLHLADPLPVVPVPLRSPDPDVPLDLPAALHDIYEEAAYDLSIDYDVPPPPPALTERDRDCCSAVLQAIARE
ncbi:MAG: DUF4058 family protein, partial [Cyanobacteria bacterium J06648_11]